MEVGVRCVAVPVGLSMGSPMALSVSGPTVRTTDEFVRPAVPELVRAAHELSVVLA